ncbi:hypothetical protein BN871_HY_00040 [Paenibacillus sp. P22]|nr:hypothetical protein BN871_HY_00040 [Paenibacillus sp. P22]
MLGVQVHADVRRRHRVSGVQHLQRHLRQRMGRLRPVHPPVPLPGLRGDSGQHDHHQPLQAGCVLHAADHSCAAAERAAQQAVQALRPVGRLFAPLHLVGHFLRHSHYVPQSGGRPAQHDHPALRRHAGRLPRRRPVFPLGARHQRRLQGGRLGHDHLPGRNRRRQRGSVRGGPHRRRQQAQADMACHAAGDPSCHPHPAHSESRQHSGGRLPADFPPVQPARLRRRGHYRYVRVPGRHPGSELQLRDGGGTVQVGGRDGIDSERERDRQKKRPGRPMVRRNRP